MLIGHRHPTERSRVGVRSFAAARTRRSLSGEARRDSRLRASRAPTTTERGHLPSVVKAGRSFGAHAAWPWQTATAALVWDSCSSWPRSADASLSLVIPRCLELTPAIASADPTKGITTPSSSRACTWRGVGFARLPHPSTRAESRSGGAVQTDSAPVGTLAGIVPSGPGSPQHRSARSAASGSSRTRKYAQVPRCSRSTSPAFRSTLRWWLTVG